MEQSLSRCKPVRPRAVVTWVASSRQIAELGAPLTFLGGLAGTQNPTKGIAVLTTLSGQIRPEPPSQRNCGPRSLRVGSVAGLGSLEDRNHGRVVPPLRVLERCYAMAIG